MAEENSAMNSENKPLCVIVLGMAGSGKTSLSSMLAASPKKPYTVNIDPACLNLPYFANIDIRDTVNYKEVMKKYKLGPNGAIVTSLNLFSTKFPEVISYIEKSDREYCVLDTPGQIEVFTWSISGTIITEALASTFPTVILYVIDCVRSASPITFMSNMLYACSILYKTRLPFIVVMNKIDIVSHSYVKEWISDFEVFHQALEADQSYISNLTRTMALTLDEFYQNLKICGVSSVTSEGMDELFGLIDQAKNEYESDYKVEWQKIREQMDAKKKESDVASLEISKPPLITEQPKGIELSDIYLRHPANESSSDSEGEEVNCHEQSNEAFQKALQQQREMQIKRAKEAESRKQQSTSNN